MNLPMIVNVIPRTEDVERAPDELRERSLLVTDGSGWCMDEKELGSGLNALNKTHPT